MKKLAFLSDLIFAFFVAFLVTLLLFRYLELSLPLSLFLALLCAACVSFAVWAYLSHKCRAAFLRKSEASKKEKLLLHLALAGDERNAEFFIKLFPSPPCKRTGKARIASVETVYFIKFSFAPVSADDLAPFVRLKTNRAKILLCSRADESAKDLCARFDIRIQDGDEIFNIARNANLFPDEFLGEQTLVKPKPKPWKLCFSKSYSRRFLTSGAFVLLLSRLSPFPFYYLIFGGFLVAAAVFTRIFGKQ